MAKTEKNEKIPAACVPFLYRPIYQFPLFARLFLSLFMLSILLAVSAGGGFLYFKSQEKLSHELASYRQTVRVLSARLDKAEQPRVVATPLSVQPDTASGVFLEQVNDLSDRLKKSEERLVAMESVVYNLQTGTMDMILSTLNTFDSEIETFKKEIDALRVSLQAVKDNSVAPSTILTLIARIEDVQQEMSKRFKERRHFALLSSIVLLKDSITSGKPFDVEILATQSLADGDPFVTSKVATLLPFAQKGVLSTPALLASFDAALTAPVSAAVPVEKPTTTLGRIKHFMSSLFIVRKVGTTPEKTKEAFVRSDFQKYLEDGDLAHAVTAIDMLPNDQKAALKASGFNAQFGDYAACRQAIHDLLAYSYAALAADRL